MTENSNRESKLVKNVGIYMISSFGSKALSFLIIPLYTYYLSTAEYGTYDTIVSLVNVLAPMCMLCIHEGLLRWLLKSDDENSDVIGTGISIYALSILLSDIIVYFILHIRGWEYTVVFVVLITVSSLQSVMQFIARGLKKNKVFALSGAIYTFVMLILNVIIVIVFRFGISGMLYSMSIAHLVASIYIFSLCKNELLKLRIKTNKKLYKDMVSYSVMLVPNRISWWVMNASDRLMLTNMIGSSFTGIYSVACKFPTILSVFHSIFYQAWQEQAVLEFDSEMRDKYYSKIFQRYAGLLFGAILCMIPVSKIYVLLFMEESYKTAYYYIGILFIGSIFSAFSEFYGTAYISAKETKQAMITTSLGAIINVAINFFFIKRIGIWAACISTAVAYLVLWIVRLFQTRKYFSIDVGWKRFIFLITFVVLYCILNFVDSYLMTAAMFIIAIIVTIIVNKSIMEFGINKVKRKLTRRH